MDYKQIQYIIKVAECQSMTKAADQLYISQPALSQYISKTEQEFGAKIFNRKTNPISLTREGEEYIKTARKIVALEDNLHKTIDDMQAGKKGQLRMALTDSRATYVLPALLPKFRLLYPNIDLKPMIYRAPDLEGHVMNGDADLGFIPLYNYSKDFRHINCYDEELLVVSTEPLPSSNGLSRPWVSYEQLSGKDIILLNNGGNRLRMAVDTLFLEHNVRPNSIINMPNNMASYMLASTGLGIAIVPETIPHFITPIKQPHLYSLGKGGFRWTLGVIYRPDVELSGACEYLIKLLKSFS